MKRGHSLDLKDLVNATPSMINPEHFSNCRKPISAPVVKPRTGHQEHKTQYRRKNK